MAKYDPELLKKVQAAYKDPAYRDALNMIAASEGTYNQGADGYNVRFGGTLISDMSKHPDAVASYRDKNNKTIQSTAAGRYQFIKSTWDDYAEKLGLKDFSPMSQDLAAIAMMIDKGAAKDIENGNLTGIVNRLNSTWTSLPGSAVGAKHHGLRNPAFVAGAYNQSREARGEKPVSFDWDGIAYTDTSIPGGMGGQGQVQAQSFTNQALAQFGIHGLNNYKAGDFIRRAYTDYALKSYGAQPGDIAPNTSLALSANPLATQDNLRSLIGRVFNVAPDTGYGMAYSNGIRPTVVRTDPATGTTKTIIEFPNDVYVDADSGERVTSDGEPFVQEGVPLPMGEPATQTTPAIPANPTAPANPAITNGTDTAPPSTPVSAQGASSTPAQPLTHGAEVPSADAGTSVTEQVPLDVYINEWTSGPAMRDLDVFNDSTALAILRKFRNA